MGLKDFIEWLKKRWQDLNTRQKTVFLLIGIPFLAVFFFLLSWVGKVEMAPLFTNLDAKDASAIVERLKENQVKYELDNQGTTILVPKKRLYELRLDMAASGIVTGGDLGWELFDQSNLVGVTDFDRKLNYQRALQEELRRTVIQLGEVDQARVHLVIPEKSVFVEEETPSSASVALKLKLGKKLAPNQVRGIVLLVANSVEGLKEENVNVIDMEGNVLSDSLSLEVEGNLTGSALKHHQMQREFEQGMEEQIQSLLDKIFGSGKAIAIINADLVFDAHEKRVVTYGNPVVRTETGSRQGSNGAIGGVSGVSGAMENVPDYDAIDPENPTEGQANYDLAENGLEQYSRSYEFDATEEKIVFAPGEVRKMSVAVVVDGQLTPLKATEVQNLVIAAVGLDPNRGDQITVSSMAFDTSLKDELEKSFAEDAKLQELAKLNEMKKIWVEIGLAAILLLVVVGVLFRNMRTKRKPALDVIISEPVSISQMEEETTISAEVMARKQQQERAKKYLAEQPEQAANILKTWLSYEE